MGDAHCPFCGAAPRSIRDIYPEAKDRSLACPTWGCPAGAAWVHPDIWNTRTECPDEMEETARRVTIPGIKPLRTSRRLDHETE